MARWFSHRSNTVGLPRRTSRLRLTIHCHRHKGPRLRTKLIGIACCRVWGTNLGGLCLPKIIPCLMMLTREIRGQTFSSEFKVTQFICVAATPVAWRTSTRHAIHRQHLQRRLGNDWPIISFI